MGTSPSAVSGYIDIITEKAKVQFDIRRDIEIDYGIGTRVFVL
jgi:hypothetical protein